jgi:signal transduction histidine kinase
MPSKKAELEQALGSELSKLTSQLETLTADVKKLQADREKQSKKLDMYVSV